LGGLGRGLGPPPPHPKPPIPNPQSPIPKIINKYLKNQMLQK